MRTPLVPFGTAGAGGPRILLKAESLQSVGAFKIRGAYHAIASLTAEERSRGVVTHSSGNHAQGVARAARLLGTHAVIVMPSNAPAIKRRRVEADGAEVVTVGPASSEREAKAEELQRERGLVFVPPYDDDRIIAGQGTLGLEIAEDVPDLAAVLVPIGGGGLSSGVAVAIRALHPQARILGVEPEVAADAKQSLREGRIVRWEPDRCHDRRRRPVAGDRTPAFRPPVAAPRRRGDGRRGGDRRGRAPDRRGGAPRGGAVGRAGSGGGALPRARGGHRPARGHGGRHREWRQRRSGALPGAAALPDPGPRQPGSALGAGARQLVGALVRRCALGVCRSAAGASRSSRRIQAATTASTAPMNTTSPTSHMIPPASCWSASAVIPYGAPRVT
jgi:cysteine synthase